MIDCFETFGGRLCVASLITGRADGDGGLWCQMVM